MDCVKFIVIAIGIGLLVCVWRVLNWVWFRPKKLEKLLKEQGLKGNAYRILYGDTKQLSGRIKEANSKCMSLYDDNIAPRLVPFFLDTINKYGMFSFISHTQLFGVHSILPRPDMFMLLLLSRRKSCFKIFICSSLCYLYLVNLSTIHFANIRSLVGVKLQKYFR